MADRELRLRMILEGLDKLTAPLKAVAGASGVTNKELSETRTTLKALDAVQQDIGRFRELKTGLSETAKQMELARTRASELGRQIAQTENPSRQLRTEFNRARKESEQLTARHQLLHGELGTLRGRLDEAGVSTRNLVEHERRLRTETDQANEALRAQTDALDRQAQAHRNSEKLRDISGKATALGIGLTGAGTAAAAPVAIAVKQAMALEKKMSDVRKVVDFPTPEAFKAMTNDIRRLAMEIPIAEGEIADIIAEAGRAGVPREELLRFGKDAAQMAVALETSGGEAGAMMAKWRNAFAMGQDEVVELGNQINALTNNFGGNVAAVTQTVTAIGPLGRTAATAGAQIAGLSQIMDANGVDANIAATGIKNMLLALTSGDAATKRQSKAYQALGLDAVKMSKQMQRDAGGAILTVLERIQALPAAAQASTLSQLFGTQSVTAIAPLLNNLDELKRNFALVGNESQYAGSMLEEYTNAIDNSEGSVQLAINSQKALAGIMGDTLLPMVQDIADQMREAGKGMFEWAEQHPNLTKAIMMFMGVGGGLLILLGALALAFAAVTFAAAPLVKILGVSIGAFFGWAAAIIAAIALVATAAYLIYENWDTLVTLWNDTWAAIGEVASAALDLLIDGFMNFTPLGLFIQAMMPVLDYLRSIDLGDIGRELIAGLIKGITDQLKALKDTVVGAASSVSNWFKEKLGIHSPSRVFAQYGGFMMQGLEGGIAADQAGPLDRIRMISADIMKAMAAGAAVPAIAASPAAAAASPSSASIGPVTIVIQQQPGQNAQDLARLVRQEIEAIKRGEAAAARSRFADEQDYGGFL
ncbi:MAG TPA: phage tail tape measure protein [Sphingobium sp.]|nr:phage tail tape measure protein [Sphingobium sp.]